MRSRQQRTSNSQFSDQGTKGNTYQTNFAKTRTKGSRGFHQSTSVKTNSDGIPLCPGHSKPCMLLTTKKPGPNCGRTFYKCSVPNDQCDFFQWADQ